ncbi:hypothetical protein KHA80_00420 [Anaerobacillus sp. HL2]|nr:hypothetical protein KHA80_00420 [Anaerobacillus sp. HL2]
MVYGTGIIGRDIETTGVKLGYFEHLKAIHLNNSKYSTGKRKDRHANLMEGFISEPQWTSFLNSTIQMSLLF